MNMRYEVLATVIQHPDLANVIGYAEYPYVEVARVAENHGMQELASQKRAEAQASGVQAGREWIESLGQQFTSATGEPVLAGIPIDALRLIEDPNPMQQEQAPKIPPVNPSIVSRIVAVVLTHKNEHPLTFKEIERRAGISNPTAVRAINGLCALDLISKGQIKGKMGRPEITIHGSESLAGFAEKFPSWRNATELLKLREQLGLSEEQVMTYLISLGKASLTNGEVKRVIER